MASARSRIVLVALGTLGLVALAGCDPTYTARLTDGGGLIEGSPVRVAQVTVGEVRSVRIVEGQVEVEIRVEREHELSMRVDTCAVPVETPAGPALALNIGVGTLLEEPKTIPQCQPPPADQMGDFLRQLGEGMGDLMRVFGQGLQGVTRPPPVSPPGSAPARSPAPMPASPVAPSPSSPVPAPSTRPTPVGPPPNMPPPPDQAI